MRAFDLSGASERIEEHRKGDLTVRAVRQDGTPMPGRRLSLEQTESAFLFGCNIFRLDPGDTGGEQERYQQRFRNLLNYATLPFYWGRYEPSPGETRQAQLRAMAEWCADNGIRTKGHPLVWHEVYPDWADRQAAPAVQLLQERVRRIVSGFSGLVDTWDVINESTTSERFDNGVGDWAREAGMVQIAAESMRWAREAGPQATLVLNDYNIAPDYEAQIEELLAGDWSPDVIGIQSHMHSGEWPLERAWEVCETYARFGLPLHFTETTVLSGVHVPEGESMATYRPAEWPTTPEGEERQLRYVEAFYTLLFSHSAVGAITWWDLPDGCWLNAPSGLLRRDLSPKPAYERLLELITRQWRTNAELTTDEAGEASIRAFRGRYRLTNEEGGVTVEFAHAGDGPSHVELRLD
jgi:GH35 family endo-1,4-beta-xylanase